MDHQDHIRLLQDGIPEKGGVWADLGAGRGAFTLALADLVGPGSTIYAIDRDQRALEVQAREMRQRFPQVDVYYQAADYRKPLKLPSLDGVVMANTLHFHPNPEQIVRRVQNYLKPAGRLLIVEYNISRGNAAVPYPLSFESWRKLAQEVGFQETHLLASRPSRFLNEIYAACSML
jgi:ubiquinone/menaquinone biosynthesis C-methylase UbiE